MLSSFERHTRKTLPTPLKRKLSKGVPTSTRNQHTARSFRRSISRRFFERKRLLRLECLHGVDGNGTPCRQQGGQHGDQCKQYCRRHEDGWIARLDLKQEAVNSASSDECA